MTRFLASVKNVDEALIALDAGADIIDLKDPDKGALGALSADEIREITARIGGRKPVSATIGDLPMQPDRIVYGVEHTAELGVDIVKVGFFGVTGHRECAQALRALAVQGKKIVAVLFADQFPDLTLIRELKRAGFYGVMLDTSNKSGNALSDYMTNHDLGEFVSLAKSCDMECGLAGSLRIIDIPMLISLGPGYLGFRGALCNASKRTQEIERERVKQAAKLLHESNITCKNAV